MARRPNAYSQLIQEGSTSPQPEDTKTQHDTVKPQNGKTVKQQYRNTAPSGKTVKITIYPSPEQLAKLYDFMEAYRKKTGMRINQQDIIRRIIDVADLNTVLP
jgi:hypothetical protein